MTKLQNNPYEGLQRAFHEPKRLAIMAALIGTPSQEMTFTELKAGCDLTDGNLNRHLKTLEEAGAVAFRRSPGPGRAQTIVSLTKGGHRAFLEYLIALEEVLKIAAAAAKPQAAASSIAPALARPFRA
jgi:DNA-binding transcriptional ArsR family regulator